TANQSSRFFLNQFEFFMKTALRSVSENCQQMESAREQKASSPPPASALLRRGKEEEREKTSQRGSQEIVTPFLALKDLSNVTERQKWAERYREIRAFSEELCKPLHAEDCVIQSMPDASPAKWHLAHTSWFFETFILRPGLNNYRDADPHNSYLFNSYYNAVGPMHCRVRRGS